MTTSNHVHELANQANELTEDELNHVSGGVVRYIDDALGTGVRSEVSMTFALNSHVA